MEGIRTPEGKSLDLAPAGPGGSSEQAFARAMATPVEDIPAPPTHTKTFDKADTSSRRRAPKSTGTAAKPAKAIKPPKPPVPVKDSYVADIQPITGAAFVGLAQFEQTKHLAYVVAQHNDQLIAALDEGCKQNEEMRRFFTSVKEQAWWVPLLLVGVSMGKTAMVISKNPELKAAAVKATDDEIAKMVQSQMPETSDANSHAQ